MIGSDTTIPLKPSDVKGVLQGPMLDPNTLQPAIGTHVKVLEIRG